MILISICGAAIVAYQFLAVEKTPHSTASVSSVLDFVPADTFIFSGGINPFPLKKYIDTVPAQTFSGQQPTEKELEQLKETLPQSDGTKLMFELYMQYLTEMHQNPNFIMDSLGLAGENSSVFYMVGLMPTIKIHLNAPDKFEAFIKKAEINADITGIEKNINGIIYKEYDMFNAPNSQLALLISVKDDFATITFSSALDTEDSVAIALGAKKPAKSLAGSNQIQSVIDRYQLANEYIFYFNLHTFFNSYYNNDVSLVSQMINKIPNTNKQEMLALTKNLPGFFGGFRQLDLSENKINIYTVFAIEYRNKEMLAALKKMQGFIPSVLKSGDLVSGMLGFALGLDSSAASPNLLKIYENISSTEYQCEMIQAFHKELVQKDPNLIAAQSNIMPGLRGISMVIHKADMTDLQNVIADAMIVVSAEDPTTLFSTLAAMTPAMQNIQFPKDGEVIDLQLPLPLPPTIKPQLTLQGNHIILFNGEISKKSALDFKKETLNSDGLSSIYINYSHFFELLSKLSESYKGMLGPEHQELVTLFETMKEINMTANINMYVSDNGFEVGVGMKTQK